MKVILLKDIKGVGKNGEVVNVSEGYARNMLIPSKSALPATETVLKQVKEKQKILDAKIKKATEEAQQIAGIITKDTLNIKAKTGQGDKLYGTITNSEIAQTINEKYNLDLDKKKITIKEPIKTIGSYTADVKLYNGVSAKININVSSE